MKITGKIIIFTLLALLVSLFLARKPQTIPVESRLPDTLFAGKNTTFSLIFTGDVMLGRSVNTRIKKYADPSWPFRHIAPLLRSSDLTLVNLESPFVAGCRPTDTGMIFCSDPANVAGLVFAGVDYASLANNHTQNYGHDGLLQTAEVLRQNKIVPLLGGSPEFVKIKDTSLALLAFSDLPQIDDLLVSSAISQASQSADLVIVTFHWGYEYQKQPNRRQISLAHLAIDSGADLVVGHHPHWVQTEELYQGKPIYYSLGNLVFDQMWSAETRQGQILRLTYQKELLLQKETLPVMIYDYGQPNFYSATSDLK